MVKRNSLLKSITLSFLIGVIMSCSIVTVLAGYGESPEGYFTVYGKNYVNRSSITTGSSYVNASSYTSTQDFSNVPEGYMGIKTRILDSNDNLIAESTMIYNTKSINVIHSNNPGISGVSGNYYYSDGISAAYNGNGYDYYWTFQTPKILRD